ncbi:phytoene dehydrogenase [Rhodococcus rhodnii LMG 5362]|uniref:Phytoene dehydrogenase n=1 Tax=Rhodococcus rhodnii LMG 5362 TaxID=1273125 RepID=R7WS56_9NOCA|nr:phytoene dehydrogenase [Rhodococcus rhodnii LMG 5362]
MRHVVVVGAGLAGLSAALHLRASGRDVTLLEAAGTPGGRVGTYRLRTPDGDEFDIDSGATVLTMPSLVTAAIGGVETDPPLRITRLDPAYHARFADGASLDVHSEPDRMAAEVTRFAGPDEAIRYRRLRRWLGDVFEAEFDDFMDADFDSPLDLVASPRSLRAIVRLVRLGGFGSLGRRVGSILRDDRLARIFTFQALYAGVAPRDALGVYGAIGHMDTSMGVWFPSGGMRSIAEAMTDAARRAGVDVVFDARVDALDVAGGRVTAVRTADAVYPCDAVVLTPDTHVVDSLLAPHGLAPRRPVRSSPSAVVLHGSIPVSVTDRWPARRHHTIDFGDAWDATFREITARAGRGRLMTDPSFLVTRPATTDPDLIIGSGETAREPLSVLAPCPNLRSAPFDWDRLGPHYAREIVTTLERRGFTGIAAHFDVARVDTPATWLADGMRDGSPFAAAHVFAQTGPFRRRNTVRGLANALLAGSSTVPGVGVPTVLLSGKLAAERITGSHTRARDVDSTVSPD